MVKHYSDFKGSLLEMEVSKTEAQETKVVEVFKTNVQNEKDARLIIQRLQRIFPGSAVNFDLQDCDKILRVAFDDQSFEAHTIVIAVSSFGFEIELLS